VCREQTLKAKRGLFSKQGGCTASSISEPATAVPHMHSFYDRNPVHTQSSSCIALPCQTCCLQVNRIASMFSMIDVRRSLLCPVTLLARLFGFPGGLGGRLDHTLSNLNLLYKMPNLRLVLCGDGNLAELIPAGTTVIELDPAIQGPACGLVSLAAPAEVTTRGLVWDCGTVTLQSSETNNELAKHKLAVPLPHRLCVLLLVSPMQTIN
jgi:hypothetical protein